MRQNDSPGHRFRLAAGAVAATAALYLVIVTNTKTSPLEWFGVPWADDEAVVYAEPADSAVETAALTNGAARASTPATSVRPHSARERRPRSSSPSPATRSGRRWDTGDRTDADIPSRTPTPESSSRPRSQTSSRAPAPQSPPTSPPSGTHPTDSTTTLPPPLTEVEVTPPELPATPPELPVTPPELPVTPPALPVAPPTLPAAPAPPELPAIGELP